MPLKINEEVLNKLNFKGRGGKEQQILSCFKNSLIRENGILYDCIDSENNEKYEIKKQVNLQWFDPRKYFELSSKERNITIVFLLINEGGYCDIVATVRLDDFVNKMFSKQQLADADIYAKKYPKDQIKSGIFIRKFIENHSNIVQIIWKRKL